MLFLQFKRNDLLATLKKLSVKPKLVSFLCTTDPGCIRYAKSTHKHCDELGLSFELKKCEADELEEQIKNANNDTEINGIMIYYPVFGDYEVQSMALRFSFAELPNSTIFNRKMKP